MPVIPTDEFRRAFYSWDQYRHLMMVRAIEAAEVAGLPDKPFEKPVAPQLALPRPGGGRMLEVEETAGSAL